MSSAQYNKYAIYKKNMFTVLLKLIKFRIEIKIFLKLNYLCEK